ncbi:hypothetical protein ABW21_db0209885 [Orbilia brochopaga]|nr:hypothetical protein ABW21_db0209885 [Drechslerella brochopaga]
MAGIKCRANSKTSARISSQAVTDFNTNSSFVSEPLRYHELFQRDGPKPERWVFTIHQGKVHNLRFRTAIQEYIQVVRTSWDIKDEKFVEGLFGGMIWFYITATELIATKLALKFGEWIVGFERPDTPTSSHPYMYDPVPLSGETADSHSKRSANDPEAFLDRNGHRMLKREGQDPIQILKGMTRDSCVISQPPGEPWGTVPEPVQDKCTALIDREGGSGILVYLFSTGVFKSHKIFTDVDWHKDMWLASDQDAVPFTDNYVLPLGTMAASKIVGTNLGVAPRATIAVAKGTNKSGKLTWYSVIETMILLGNDIKKRRSADGPFSKSPIFIAFTWELAAYGKRHLLDLTFRHQQIFEGIITGIAQERWNTLLISPGDWPAFDNGPQIQASPLLYGLTQSTEHGSPWIKTVGPSNVTDGVYQPHAESWPWNLNPTVYAPAESVRVATLPPAALSKITGIHIGSLYSI